MIKRKAIDFLRVFLFAGILLVISSLFYSYKNFLLETILFFLILGLGLVFRPAKVLAVLFSFFYFLMFIVFNYNYFFILGLCLVVGLLIYDSIQNRLNIHPWIYVLIPIFILLHILFFNFVVLDINSTESKSFNLSLDNNTAPLYLSDKNNVLSNLTVKDNVSFKQFLDDRTVEIEMNNEIINISENKDYNFSLEYDSTSFISINDEILYESSFGQFKLKGLLENTYVFSKNESINFTNYNSIDQLVLSEYPNGTIILDFTKEFNNISEAQKKEFYSNLNDPLNYNNYIREKTEFNTVVRGDITFVGLFQDRVKVSVNKKDLNEFNNSEEVNVTVSFLETGKIIGSFLLKDDGEEGITEESEWREFDETLRIKEDGLYKVTFSSTNKSEDFYLSNISFNSNKFMTQGEITLIQPDTLYFDSETIDVSFWRKDKKQTLELDNEDKIKLNESNRKEIITVDTQNISSIKSKEGFIKLSGGKFSTDSETLFKYDLTPQFILSKASNLSLSNTITLSNFSKLRLKASNQTKLLSLQLNYES